jgi:hypothetical protein
MFGMDSQGKQFFLVGNRRYELIEVDGPINRAGKRCAVQFDHAAGVLKVSRQIPASQRSVVIANAVSDACFRLWKPVPVVWPKWYLSD